MIDLSKKATAYILVMLMVMGTISVHFSTKAYAVVISSDGIHEIAASGEFSIPAIGQFNSPNSVTADTYGNVYVADSGNNRIQKFDSGGNYVTQWGSQGSGNGQFEYPAGVAVDTDGNVYVADRINNRIQKFDSDGTYGLQWGIQGTGNGEFDYLSGIAVDVDGNVYVADTNNNRIQKFDSSGQYVTQWGIYGAGNGEFNYPRGITVDADSSVYVVDRNNRIQKFDSDGTYDSQWGSSGSGDGKFASPVGIAVDADGNVYVADSGDNRIQKFNSSGIYVAKWGSYGNASMSPLSIAVSNSGNVYAGDMGESRILKFDSNGTYLAQWGSSGNGNGQFFDYGGRIPSDAGKIASDAAGNVFVVDYGNHRVQKFDSSGSYVTQWGGNGSADGLFISPSAIAVDAAGNVYVTDTDSTTSRIQKFKFNAATSSYDYDTQWGSYGSGDGEFDSASGIAVDADGYVYVLDAGNSRIQKFKFNAATTSYDYDTQWGSYGSGDGEFDSASGIALDTDGKVYVADTNNNRIQKFDSNGGYVTSWGSGLESPKGVAVDKGGKIYIVGNGTKIFSPNNNTKIMELTLSNGLSPVSLNPSFTSGTTSYTANVATDVAAVMITPELADPMAAVSIADSSGPVTSSVNNGVTSYAVPLNSGTNTITLTVKAYDGRTTKDYTVAVSRLPAITSTIGTVSTGGTVIETITNIPYTSTLADFKAAITPATNATFEVYDADGTTVATTLATGKKVIVTAQDGTTKVTYTVTVNAPDSGSGNSSITPIDNPVTSTDGKLTLPTGKKGEVSLGDAVTISIPANAANKELKLTIDKVLDTQKLLTNKETLASPIFEILKNFSENFSNPVTLTFVFDPASLKKDQKPVVYYYDEVKKQWVKVGGKVNGNRITVEVDHFTKYTVLAVGEQAEVPTEPQVNFNDISGHWAEANIKQAVSDGIVSGYTDGTFKPNHTVTRAEFAVMLMNALKPQSEGTALTFTDTAMIGGWAQKAVAQAVQAGIIKGYIDGSFRPDAEITRTEMAAMIAKALGQPIEATTATGFADDKDIPEWAKSAAAALQKLGIIGGKGANTFAPADKTTRAEAVTVLLKMLAHQDK